MQKADLRSAFAIMAMGPDDICRCTVSSTAEYWSEKLSLEIGSLMLEHEGRTDGVSSSRTAQGWQ